MDREKNCCCQWPVVCRSRFIAILFAPEVIFSAQYFSESFILYHASVCSYSLIPYFFIFSYSVEYAMPRTFAASVLLLFVDLRVALDRGLLDLFQRLAAQAVQGGGLLFLRQEQVPCLDAVSAGQGGGAAENVPEFTDIPGPGIGGEGGACFARKAGHFFPDLL